MNIVKDMAITPAEFIQRLAVAVDGLDYRVEGHRIAVGTPEQGLAIALKPLPARRLSGLLSLPRTEVSLAFHGYDEPGRAAFMAHFDRAYQRGGG